jgi:epoxyqueuosine reductase QueG
MSQDVCPYTRHFSQPLQEPSFAARPAAAGNGARTLALELLAMSEADYSAAFRGIRRTSTWRAAQRG